MRISWGGHAALMQLHRNAHVFLEQEIHASSYVGLNGVCVRFYRIRMSPSDYFVLRQRTF